MPRKWSFDNLRLNASGIYYNKSLINCCIICHCIYTVIRIRIQTIQALITKLGAIQTIIIKLNYSDIQSSIYLFRYQSSISQIQISEFRILVLSLINLTDSSSLVRNMYTLLPRYKRNGINKINDQFNSLFIYNCTFQ